MEFLFQQTSHSQQDSESMQHLTKKVKTLEKDLYYYKKTSRDLRKKLQLQDMRDDVDRRSDSMAVDREGTEKFMELSGCAPKLVEKGGDRRRGQGAREEVEGYGWRKIRESEVVKEGDVMREEEVEEGNGKKKSGVWEEERGGVIDKNKRGSEGNETRTDDIASVSSIQRERVARSSSVSSVVKEGVTGDVLCQPPIAEVVTEKTNQPLMVKKSKSELRLLR